MDTLHCFVYGRYFSFPFLASVQPKLLLDLPLRISNCGIFLFLLQVSVERLQRCSLGVSVSLKKKKTYEIVPVRKLNSFLATASIETNVEN